MREGMNVPVTLRDVLKLPSTAKIKLISGHRGLDQVITRTLIGHIDYVSEIYGGELLFITGAGFRSDEGSLKSLISESVYKNLAGIVFTVPGDLMQVIHRDVMAFAENLGFPLFQIPYDVKLSKVAKGIEGYIKQRSDEEEILNILLERIIYAGSEEMEGIKKRIAHLGYHFASAYQTAAMRVLQPQGVYPNGALRREYIHLYIRNLLNRSRSGTLTMTRQDEILIFLPAEGEKNDPPDLTSVYDAVITHFPGIHLKIGLWQLVGGPTAGELRGAGSVAREDSIGSDFGVFRLCCDSLGSEEIEAFCDRYIGKLVRYDELNDSDLVHTIQVYYENRFNLSRTAKDLMIHRNSLMYRLRRIEEILDRKLSAPYVLLDLINSVYIKKAIESFPDQAG